MVRRLVYGPTQVGRVQMQGLPPEWGKVLPDGTSKDEAKLGTTLRHVAPPKPTAEVTKKLNPTLRKFSWWRSKEEAPLAGTIIGAPFNVQHTTHVRAVCHCLWSGLRCPWAH